MSAPANGEGARTPGAVAVPKTRGGFNCSPRLMGESRSSIGEVMGRMLDHVESPNVQVDVYGAQCALQRAEMHGFPVPAHIRARAASLGVDLDARPRSA